MIDKNREYKIAFRGLSVGKHSYEFDFDSSFFERMSNGEFKQGNCSAIVTLEKGSSLIVLDCNITGEVMVECDRCLDEFMMDVEFNGSIFVKFSEEVDEPFFDNETDSEADLLWMNPSDDFIDLAQYLYESAILSLPYSRVHGKDQNGELLCNKDMLARFTISDDIEDDDYQADDEDDDNDEL